MPFRDIFNSAINSNAALTQPQLTNVDFSFDPCVFVGAVGAMCCI